MSKKSSLQKPLPELLQKLFDAWLHLGVNRSTTKKELRQALQLGNDEQDAIDRRIRDLRAHLRGTKYSIPRWSKKLQYRLVLVEPSQQTTNTDPIPGRLRAEILNAAQGRCGMCGKTITEDHIKLEIDHHVPRTWGGTTERDNLWALCQECNIQKKDFFDTLPVKILSNCMQYKLTVQRLGEFLKVFDHVTNGCVPPRYMFEVVGQDYAWPRRLRELRPLGWRIKKVIDTTQKGRHRWTYQLLESKPWPTDIQKAIRAAKKRR